MIASFRQDAQLTDGRFLVVPPIDNDCSANLMAGAEHGDELRSKIDADPSAPGWNVFLVPNVLTELQRGLGSKQRFDWAVYCPGRQRFLNLRVGQKWSDLQASWPQVRVGDRFSDRARRNTGDRR